MRHSPSTSRIGKKVATTVMTNQSKMASLHHATNYVLSVTLILSKARMSMVQLRLVTAWPVISRTVPVLLRYSKLKKVLFASSAIVKSGLPPACMKKLPPSIWCVWIVMTRISATYRSS